MRIDINNQYAIESDSMEFTIKKKRMAKDKNGNETGIEIEDIANRGHHGTLESALKELLNTTIRESKTENDLVQLVKEVRQMKADINKALEGINAEEIVKEICVEHNED